jgi:hypothetical protein
MKNISHNFEFVVVGGGFAGMLAAVTSARAGVKTALIQDRPVLGGNASKEIRVTPVGADNCNFLYSRETGMIEEIYLKNLHDNPSFSYEGFDIVLNGIVKAEQNLSCFFNTIVNEVEVDSATNQIQCVKGYTVGSEIWHTFTAPFFADCTGDATIGALAGAPFRIGVEAKSEFNESMCEEEAQPFCMGGSVQFHTIDTGSPKPFIKPEWINLDLNHEHFNDTRPVTKDFYKNNGGYWWIEVGGNADTVHDTANIFEGAREIALATWDYLKNKSSLKEELVNFELNWVGPIAGKRESRRLEGDYILSMGDIEPPRHFDDAIAFGGWGFDHHPPKGFYDYELGSYHTYHPSPYNIPLRSLYSRHINNLFMAGRNISASHYALSSTRVMFTTAQLGEAVGMAAAICFRNNQLPRQIVQNYLIAHVQNDLIKNDHHLHNWPISLPDDIAPKAKVSASSTLSSPDVIESLENELLKEDRMLMFPVVTNQLESIDIWVDVSEDCTLEVELYRGPETKSTFPTDLIWSGKVSVTKGKMQWVSIQVLCKIARPGWHFLVLKSNPGIAMHVGHANVGTSNYSVRPIDPIRPDPSSKWHTGKAALYASGDFLNKAFCFQVQPSQPVYSPENVVNQHSRPTNQPNMWASKHTDFSKPEWIELSWDKPHSPTEIHLIFDSVLDFHFNQRWGGYKNNVLPSIVKHYRLWAYDSQGKRILIEEINNNYQRLRKHPCGLKEVKSIRLEILATNGLNRAHVYAIRVFE